MKENAIAAWDSYTLSLYEIMEKKFKINVKITILKIEKLNTTYYYRDNICIPRKQQLKWIINKNMINKLRKMRSLTTFHGYLNNAIFVLGIIHNGIHKEDK